MITTAGIKCNVDPLLFNTMKAYYGKWREKEVDSDMFSLYQL